MAESAEQELQRLHAELLDSERAWKRCREAADEAEERYLAARRRLVDRAGWVPPDPPRPVPPKRVLILGGTGYLGQFLTRDLASAGHEVTISRNSSAALDEAAFGRIRQVQCDLTDPATCGELWAGEPPALIINCAAVSQPKVCEEDPERAVAINSPARLLEAMRGRWGAAEQPPLFLHISTDQVFRGTDSFSKESDTERLAPVNAYGRSKLQGERDVARLWANHLILRPSIIFGPRPPGNVQRALFVQFIEQTLKGDVKRSFFDDEWRCPVYVKDFTRIAQRLLGDAPAYRCGPRVLNCGGPERLSRLDMARTMATRCGWTGGLVNITSASAASVDRGVASPADISMDSALLQQTLGIALTPYGDALCDFANYASPGR